MREIQLHFSVLHLFVEPGFYYLFFSSPRRSAMTWLEVTIKFINKQAYPSYHKEFGHLEGDTIIGKNHKSAVITFAERASKLIIALKTPGRKAEDIEVTLTNWFKQLPKNLFKSITFDCGKEFSNWKSLSNQQDISVFFADPGCPSQRGLNEHSNGLLRKDGLPKQMDFNEVNQAFISSVAIRRNKIPRKSLNYKTPLEVFLENVSGLNYF